MYQTNSIAEQAKNAKRVLEGKRFQTWGEALVFADKAPTFAAEGGGDSRKTNDRRFFGTDTWQDALELAYNGWPEGEKYVHRMSADLRQSHHGVDRS